MNIKKHELEVEAVYQRKRLADANERLAVAAEKLLSKCLACGWTPDESFDHGALHGDDESGEVAQDE
jgi:hypothetical protein